MCGHWLVIHKLARGFDSLMRTFESENEDEREQEKKKRGQNRKIRNNTLKKLVFLLIF